MKKSIEKITNTALTGIGAAMGIAVIVLNTLDAGFAVNDAITMLGIAVAAFGLLALNKLPKETSR